MQGELDELRVGHIRDEYEAMLIALWVKFFDDIELLLQLGIWNYIDQEVIDILMMLLILLLSLDVVVDDDDEQVRDLLPPDERGETDDDVLF